MTTASSRIRSRLQRLGIGDDPAQPMSNGESHSTDESGSAESEIAGKGLIYASYYSRLKRHVQHGWPVLLEGPAAAGKSTAVRQLAEELGATLFVQQCHRTLSVEEIRGTRGLNEQGTTFEPGLLTASLRHPHGWYFAEELNMADPAILSLLNNLLDGSREITIPETGEVVAVPVHWRFLGAYNAGYVGAGELNQALVSRCVVVECDFFPPAIEADLIRQKYPAIGERAETIIKVAHIVRSSRANGEHQFDMCLRTCFQMAEEWLESGSLPESFEATVLPKIGDRHTFGPVRDGLLEAVLFLA